MTGAKSPDLASPPFAAGPSLAQGSRRTAHLFTHLYRSHPFLTAFLDFS